MIKPILTTLMVVALAVFSADAKTVKIPDADGPVASITFPDDWEVEEMEGGYGADSPDNHVYISAVAVEDETDMNAQIDDVFKMLAEHKVELDESTKKEEKFKLNGLDASELQYQGKDEDGACGVSIVFIPVKNNLIIFTYWITTAQQEKHEAAVGKIVNSLKPTK
jgi:hypothetical protein